MGPVDSNHGSGPRRPALHVGGECPPVVGCYAMLLRRAALVAEAVEGAALALEGVHDVHGGDGLAAGVLSVGHGVTDHVLEEHLEDRAGLLVDEAGDARHTATAS